MKYLYCLGIILLSALGQYSYGQDQVEALRLIEDDFKNLLISTAELNLELTRIEDINIKTELTQAKRDLIADFVSGPFKIFTNGQSKITQGGKVNSIKKGSITLLR